MIWNEAHSQRLTWSYFLGWRSKLEDQDEARGMLGLGSSSQDWILGNLTVMFEVKYVKEFTIPASHACKNVGSKLINS